MEPAATQKGRAYLSKLRFAAIVALIESAASADGVAQESRAPLVREITDGIRGIMQFDPDATTYTAANKEWRAKWLQRKQAATGKSLYEIEGGKAAYARAHARPSPSPSPV